MSKAPLGVLVLHGYTANPNAVKSAVDMITGLGMPVRSPALRGHGTVPQDLLTVTKEDWLADAMQAALVLMDEAEKLIIVGHSMGGCASVALASSEELAGKLIGVILLAPAFAMHNPLLRIAFNSGPTTQRIITAISACFLSTVSPGIAYDDIERQKFSTNYARVPTAAIITFIQLAVHSKSKLPEVKVPVACILMKRDRIVNSDGVKRILEKRLTNSTLQITELASGGHEMLLDSCSDTVVAEIKKYLQYVLASNNAFVAF